MDDWQPLETAPKDGTEFRLRCQHGPGNFREVTAKWIGTSNGWWQDVRPGSCVGVYPGGRNEITAKWKPLHPRLTRPC